MAMAKMRLMMMAWVENSSGVKVGHQKLGFTWHWRCPGIHPPAATSAAAGARETAPLHLSGGVLESTNKPFGSTKPLTTMSIASGTASHTLECQCSQTNKTIQRPFGRPRPLRIVAPPLLFPPTPRVNASPTPATNPSSSATLTTLQLRSNTLNIPLRRPSLAFLRPASTSLQEMFQVPSESGTHREPRTRRENTTSSLAGSMTLHGMETASESSLLAMERRDSDTASRQTQATA